MAKAQTTHIAILPSPGMGHLIPLVQFAKRLVHQHSFNATFIIPTDGSPSKAQKSTLDSLPSSIDSVFLPPINLTDLPGDSKIETVISLTVSRSLPYLRDAFKSLVAKTNLVGLVVDLFGTDAFDVANEFGLSPYIFYPSTVMALSLSLYLQELDQKVSCEYRDMSEPVRIPGCIAIQGKELPDSIQTGKTTHTSGCFIMSPNDSVAHATFFSIESQNDPFEFLPKGFIERTKDRGLLVPSWAPQAQVLSHGSTGGFLTHCRWNSTLESVVNGVSLIVWPLYAEQKMKALMLTEDAKVALRPKPNENGLICRDDIAKVVKGLMEGEEGKSVRTRMKELKEAAAKVLGENGSSTKALSHVANKFIHQALQASRN
ncbi:UDP-glycosyltransferase 72B1 [Hibiscus syriacus]|uniref:UDP-glycosyltransferase 72B1 n=1 Tax=Hibiscus syriacus TaxID=106335 RepID=A0A6A2Y6D6_HIBSY|nr:UDP-glycosyltransferase 72B1 [Hibiscus syriacus]